MGLISVIKLKFGKLMIQKTLLFILIALIAVQSVDAMADAVKFHQPNSAFSETDYFPVNKSNIAQQNDLQQDDNPSTQVDSDHCCYCHGINGADLTDNSLSFFAVNAKEPTLFFHNKYCSTHLSTDLRPPIV